MSSAVLESRPNAQVFPGLSRSHSIVPVLGVFCLALLLRLLLVFTVEEFHSPQALDGYEIMGRNILEGNWLVFPYYGATAYRVPLYPLLIAAVYRLFGIHPQAVWAVQCVLGAMTAGLLVMLARRFVGERLALLAGCVAAVYPPFIRCSGFLLSETLFTFLLIAGLVAFRLEDRQMSRSRRILAAVLFGLAALTRPIGFFLPLGLAVLAVGLGLWRGDRAVVGRMAGFVGIFLLVLSPWALRNWVFMGTPLWTTTQGGESLWLGLHPDPRGPGFGGVDHFQQYHPGQEGTQGEVAADRFFKRESAREIFSDPWKFLGQVPWKIAWLFYPFDGEDYALGSTYNLPCALVMTLGMLGILLGGFRPRHLLLLYVTLYFIAFTALIYGLPRFRVPLEPVLILWVFVGLEAIGRKTRARARVWAVAACALVLMNVMLVFGAEEVKKGLKNWWENARRTSFPIKT